jgi:hypothetical protein
VRNYRGNVEDENYRAVTENRSAGYQLRSDEAIFERFDDELFFAHEAIDDEAELAIARTDNNDENALRAFGLGF